MVHHANAEGSEKSAAHVRNGIRSEHHPASDGLPQPDPSFCHVFAHLREAGKEHLGEAGKEAGRGKEGDRE